MGPVHMIPPDKRKWYHFAWVGDARAKAKFAHQPISQQGFDDWFNSTWKSLNTRDADASPKGNPIHFVIGDLGYVKFDGKLPSYINVDQLWEDLNNER